MLLAIRTTWGIHAESDENASGSSPSPPIPGVSTGPRAAVRTAAESQRERAPLLGQDADRDLEPSDEIEQRIAQQRPPVLADVAQLAGRARWASGGRVPA